MRKKNYPSYEVEECGSLNEMVCRKAQRCGNEIAFQYILGKTVHSITYQQFLDDVLVAGMYINDICQAPVHVAILGENSYQWLVVFMAVVMCGYVAVPLDRELNTDDIRKRLLSSDSQICFYSSQYNDVAEKLGAEISVKFLQMNFSKQTQCGSDVYPGLLEKWNVSLDVKRVAVLFFTSGTSGDSKAVMLNQENIMSDIIFTNRRFLIIGTVLAALPFHHTFGCISGVFTPFYHGNTVFINSSLRNIKRDMLQAKPCTMVAVPLFVKTFHKNIWQSAKAQKAEKKLQVGMLLSKILSPFGINIKRRIFRSVLDGFGGKLTYIVCGGAPLQPKYIREFRALGIEIVNGYGITECSAVVAGNSNFYHRDGSVGRVLEGCKVRVKRDDVEQLSGEIQIQGKNVMIGYYHDEQATNTAFEDGWFRTGDLGYVDDDGFLYITGRKKDLIILSNGENISPEELENLLLDYDIIKEVIVYPQGEMITAEIFPESAASMENTRKQLQNIIDTCNQSLPSYKKIQSFVVRQSEFEKTTTKKIRR